MVFDPANAITCSNGQTIIDHAAINGTTTLDLSLTNTKKGASIKHLLDYLALTADQTTYDDDPTYPVTVANGEFDVSPTYGARGTESFQYKSYNVKTWSGATAPTQNFDPDLMDY